MKDLERQDRLGFIKKVYTILSVQLIITASSIAAVKLTPGLNSSFKGFGVWAIVALLVAIVIEIMILCVRRLARKVPVNYLLLLVFTLCEAFAFSVICSYYSVQTTLAAAGTTAAITVALTAYAMLTNTDFTMMGGMIVVVSVAVLVISLMSVFLHFVAWWHPLVSCILIVFYGLFLIYDTQLVAGGKKHSLSLDDYILGALIIYVDVMGIFLELLQLFGSE